MAQSNYKKSKVALFLVALAALVPSGGAAMERPKKKNGSSLLFKGIVRNNKELVLQEIKNGADVNAFKNKLLPIHFAAYYGHSEIVAILIENDADIHSRDTRGCTPLHNAINKNEHTDVVKILVKKGALVDAKTKKGYTPLHLACMYGKLEALEILVTSGAPINAPDNSGNTPLHFACEFGFLNIVEFLLSNKTKKANINAKNKNGFIPLHIATQNGYFKVVKFLIENDSQVDAQSKDEKQTPLHHAVYCRHLDVVKFLLCNKIRKANINAKDKLGYSSLHLASMKGHHKIVKLLLEYGANPKDQTKECFKTPLEVAIRQGHIQVIMVFIQKDSTTCIKTVLLNPLTYTPPHIRKAIELLHLFQKDKGDNRLNENVSEEECSICLEPFKKRDAVVFSCGHIHHKSCITLYRLNGGERGQGVKTCPLCNKVVEDDEIFG